jgi:hypothetical protein
LGDQTPISPFICGSVYGGCPDGFGIVFAHYIVDGAIVFKNACALGCEGIVSNGSAREAEEDWS